MITQQQKSLAYEIARTLNDMDSLSMHLSFVERYQEAFLRKMLAKVMALPEEKIKRTRGALYTHLVKQNGNQNTFDSRD